MRQNAIAALAVATLIAVVGAGYAVHQRAGQLASNTRAELLLPGLADRLGQAEQVELTQGKTVIRLARKGEQWVAPDKADYPAKFEVVRRNLVALSDLKTLEAKTTKSDLHGRLQLDDPKGESTKAVGFTLKDAKGAVIADMVVGKRRTNLAGGADRSYVRKADDSQAWLVEGALDLRMDAAEWLEREIVNLPAQRFHEASTIQPDGKRLTVRRAKPDDADYAIVGLPANAKIKSQFTVNGIAGALDGLTLDDVRSVSELEFKPAGGWAEFKSPDGLTIKVEIASWDEKSWVRLSAAYQTPPAGTVSAGEVKTPEQVQDEVKAINARLRAWAFLLNSYKLEKFQTKLAELLEDPKAS